MTETTPPIINAEQLLPLLTSQDLIIIDATYGKDAFSNYEKKHIKGALFVDLNLQLAEIKEDAANGGRHPLPKIENFGKMLSLLGISHESHVVIYDNYAGASAAARFWWMLKSVGHQKVQVLNGGLKEAEKWGLPLSTHAENSKKAADYKVEKWRLPFVEMQEIEQATISKDKIIIDVRDTPRYNGDTEPIDLVAGHIPGAINLPYTENIDENGLFLPPKLLKEKYESLYQKQIPQNIIFHCGSGVTACHSLLAIAHAGLEIPSLYVGSWSEWSRNNKPMVTK